jgi:glutaredoxin 3
MIEIWGKENCAFCSRAKSFCETRGYAFIYKQLGVDFEREQVFETFPDAKTFPQIKIHGKVIGGYTEFIKYVEDTGFNGTGHSL